MLQVLVLLPLVSSLLIKLFSPFLECRDGPPEFRAVPTRLFKRCLEMTSLLDLD